METKDRPPEDVKTLIIYATCDGQTARICRQLQEVLTQRQHRAEAVPVEQFCGSPAAYDKIIIACPVRYGKHLEAVTGFIHTHSRVLNEKQSAFVSVNLVARKPTKNTAQTNPYVQKFLSSVPWKPVLVGVFAGRLDYSLYNSRDRLLIRLIMLMTKGPLRTPEPIEYTDWNQVRDFGDKVAQMPV